MLFSRSLLMVLISVLALCQPGLAAGAGATGAGAEGDGLWHGRDAQGGVRVKLYVFESETCPHCARARPFVQALAERYPWLDVESREVTRSAANLELFGLLAARTGEAIRGVPAFFVCGRMIVGFDDPEGLGRVIEDRAVGCRARLTEAAPDQGGEPSPEARIEIPLLGALDAATLSLPVLTLVLGGLDAFNPCAFFVLLFLLSLLVHARSRARMALVGGIFVLFSGLLYFVFMAAWLNLFLVLERGRLVVLAAGLIAVVLGLLNVKDFVWFRQGPSLSIPERAKPGLFARMRGLISAESLPALLTGTVVLAAAANTYELLCTSGLPMVYTRILTLAQLPATTYYLYIAAYNVIYMIPLSAIVIVFTATLGARKLTEGQGRALKLLSGLMMLGLGLVLLVAPALLDNLLTTLLLLAAALVVTLAAVVADRLWRRHHAGT